MAYIDLNPAQVNIRLSGTSGAEQQIPVTTKSSAGANVTLGAWTELTLFLTPANVPFSAGYGPAGSTLAIISASAGSALLGATDLPGNIPPGSYQYFIQGQNPDGETLQILQTGNCTVY